MMTIPSRAALLAAQADKTPVTLTVTLPQWQLTMLERWRTQEGDTFDLSECVQDAVSVMLARYMHTHVGALDDDGRA